MIALMSSPGLSLNGYAETFYMAGCCCLQENKIIAERKITKMVAGENLLNNCFIKKMLN